MSDLASTIALPFHHEKEPRDVSDDYLIAVCERFVAENIWEPDGDFIEELVNRFKTQAPLYQNLKDGFKQGA